MSVEKPATLPQFRRDSIARCGAPESDQAVAMELKMNMDDCAGECDAAGYRATFCAATTSLIAMVLTDMGRLIVRKAMRA